jgi:hypothetical protein
MVNRSTPERTDYQTDLRNCADVEIGISYA